MEQNEALSALFKSWNLEEDDNNRFIAKIDKDKIGNIPDSIAKYNPVGVYPQPWWGNINNPKILVLGKNPSYTEKDEEEESEKFGDKLRANLESKTINWLDEKNRKYENKDKFYCTFRFWKQVLNYIISPNYVELMEEYNKIEKLLDIKLIETTKIKNKIKSAFKEEARETIDNDICDKIYEKVGFFNLCGYHSKEYDEISVAFNNEMLPTQNELKSYLKQMLNHSDCSVKMIIVVWGFDKWEKFLFNDVPNYEKKILVVNQGQGTNQCIVNSNNIKEENKKKFVEKFRNYLNNEDETSFNDLLECWGS